MFIWNIFSYSDHKHLDDIWLLSLIWTFFTSITPNGIIKINDLAVVLNIMGQGFINDITDKSNNVVLKVSSTWVHPWFLGAVRVGHLLTLCIVFVFVRDLCPMLVCVSWVRPQFYEVGFVLFILYYYMFSLS